MEGERYVGGLWCHDVLALLPDYLDGELEPEAMASVEAHVESCDLCERFGGRYNEIVRFVRRALLADTAFDQSTSASRLHRRLKAEIDSSFGPP